MYPYRFFKVSRPLSPKVGGPILIALIFVALACFGLDRGHELVTKGEALSIVSIAIAVAMLVYIALKGLVLLEETEVCAKPSLALEHYWLESSIESSSDLSQVLEEIASHAYRMFAAEGVELSLFDGASKGFHSSIVVGVSTTESTIGIHNILKHGERAEQDLVFAGELLGRLIVQLPMGMAFTPTQNQTLRTLAMHGVMILINARYSGELLAMRRESDATMKSRSGFLANLSHELRGPLGIILNASELVLEGLCGPLTADQEETLNMVRLNSEHLMELITDVLDYAKIESGKMNPDPVPVTVNDQLLELSKMVRAQADSKKHQVKCREGVEGLVVRCDRRHFRQMMINLLTNAIKYTPNRGSIEIWAERGTEGTIRICVRDTGVGIPESDRNRVFSAFERLDHVYSSVQLGTGLGLSLTKKLAELNGGTVDFSSIPGTGTTFWITLNATSIEPSEQSAEGGAVEDVRANGEHILMVAPGDEEKILISRYLRSIGYTVHFAEGEDEGRSILRVHPIALVIFGDGISDASESPMASFVREEQRSGYIPVVLLTRQAFLVDVEKYLREDIDRCLAKPVRLEELGIACRKAIDVTGRRVSLFESQARRS